MENLTSQNKTLLAGSWFAWLLLMLFLFSLCGCWSKSKVSYVPHEELEQPGQQRAADGEKTEVLFPEKLDKVSLQQVLNEERTEALKKHFTSWKGTRYRYGGLSRKGVDCSGFTLLTYKELFGMSLPRTVREQVKKGQKVQRASLQPGDLVFFKTGIFQKHVGIYLEDDQFMHASRSRGVMISRLDNSYWKKRYWKAKRI
jgi:probable lipoprotein NlpC